eukprot:Rhum_TRINITY_DN15260_c1_g1::Rhum_TRINITY_DN15260_c1_g1_i3::g.146338::m.146338
MLQALLGEVAELKQQRSITPRTVGSVGDSSELGAALEEAQRERGELDVLQGSPTHQSRTVDDEPASKAELPSVASSPPASSSHEPEWARRLREDFTAKVQSVQESKDPKVEEMLRALLGEVAELKQQRSITPRTVGSVGDSSELGAALEEAQRERGELDVLQASPPREETRAVSADRAVFNDESPSVASPPPASSSEEPEWARRLREGFEAKVQSVQESKEEPKVAKVEEMLQALLGEVAELKQQRSITPRTVGSVGDSSE